MQKKGVQAATDFCKLLQSAKFRWLCALVSRKFGITNFYEYISSSTFFIIRLSIFLNLGISMSSCVRNFNVYSSFPLTCFETSFFVYIYLTNLPHFYLLLKIHLWSGSLFYFNLKPYANSCYFYRSINVFFVSLFFCVFLWMRLPDTF